MSFPGLKTVKQKSKTDRCFVQHVMQKTRSDRIIDSPGAHRRRQGDPDGLLLHMGVRGASGLAFTSVNRYNQIWKGGLGVC